MYIYISFFCILLFPSPSLFSLSIIALLSSTATYYPIFLFYLFLCLYLFSLSLFLSLFLFSLYIYISLFIIFLSASYRSLRLLPPILNSVSFRERNLTKANEQKKTEKYRNTSRRTKKKK